MLRNTSKDTLFGKADDRLSRLASALRQITVRAHERYEDVNAWGAPSECYNLVHNISVGEREDTLSEFGLSHFEEAMELISERTTGKWIHFNSGMMF